jgi:hypothetical protein
VVAGLAAVTLTTELEAIVVQQFRSTLCNRAQHLQHVGDLLSRVVILVARPQMIKEVDVNGDGFICPEEFCNLMVP